MASVETYSQIDGDNLYNVKRVIVEELDPTTWDVKAGGTPLKISCDSTIGMEAEINEGEKKTLRDAEKIIAQAKDEDLLEALNLKLTTCRLPVELIPIVQGGTLRYSNQPGQDKKVIGYDAPKTKDGNKNKKYFKVTAYVENYDGEAVTNYVQFTFWKCKGSILSFDLKKEFFTPEFNIRATENTALDKPPYSFDYVDSLPV